MNFPLRVHGQGGMFSKAPEPQKAHDPVTAADNLFSDALVRFLEVISEGPIVGLSDGQKSIAFDATPYQNADSSLNFQDITWDIRLGNPDQTWMPGFTNAESESGVGSTIKVSLGPVVRSTAVPDLDAVNVTMRFPRMMRNETNGDVNGVSVVYSIEYKHNADVSWTHFPGSPFTQQGKTSSGVERQHYALLRPSGDVRVGPWNLRVTRITQDNDTDPLIADSIVWQSFTDVIEAKLIYPDTAYIGMQVPASSFPGGVPLRTYDITGRIIRVPSNYDPIARTYTGIWNGTFQLAWSNNPAWCTFDMLTNTRYGLALPDAKIDTAALYTIGKYCDERILDGSGNSIPRYTLNVQITSQEDAITLLNKMCSNFLSMIYYSSGGVGFSQDSPRDTDMIVNPTDVVDGSFDYQTQSYQDTPNVIMVGWKNPLLRDKGDIEVVEDQEDVSKRWAVTTTYEAFGIREQFRARLMGRWALFSGFNDGEIVVYKAGLDHMDVMPGWVISIKDPMFDEVVSGGRVLSTYLNTITLDRTINIDPLITYNMLLMMPDKSMGSFIISAPPGEQSVLTLTPAPPMGSEGALWGLQAASLDERLWRVVSRTMVDKMSVEIAAIRYHPDKYSIVESLLSIEADMYVNPQGLAVLPPINLSAEEYITVNAAGVVIPALLVSWQAPNDSKVAYYTFQVKPAGASWTTVPPNSAALTRTILDTPLNAYSVRVRSEGMFGIPSEWVTLDTFLFGLSGIPGDVTGFEINVIGDRATFKWDRATDLITSYYEIRYTPLLSGGGWVASEVLQTNIKNTTVDLPALNGTYFIKAVSYAGTYSTIEAAVVTSISGSGHINVVDLLAEHPTWPGTKTNCEVVGSVLRLSVDGNPGPNFGFFFPTATYERASIYDMGAPYLCRITPIVAAVGDKITNVMSTWPTLTSVTVLSGVSHTDWGATLMARFTNDDPLSVSPVPTWTDWAPLTISDRVFRAMDVRLDLFTIDGNLTPEVSQVSISIDMPDRVEGGKNLSIPAIGLDVDFDPPFKVLKGVSVAMQGMLATDTYQITAKDETGFTITVYNNLAVAKAGTSFDYVASGYGRVTS